MPLTRYQIRNEYGLADPELYTAADRDDPEALLEGVAMAGLVGVLRQLGDLAEFAAEIFHELHEELMTTAARGHGLMARVQQLEAEFPSVEKALLSQTNHSPFFSSGGVEWHPNLHTEQNLVTRGDLPRFVMDSYEECRGPPRLFLLDKFDVAGAGACLKRYTDPSFFKAEAPSSIVTSVEIQREKKIRKVKKKGSQWRNGETPTSHAKLHELFLEERVENGHPDPARLVKLKRRQLNGFPFDLKPGKSYMEKFLEPASPKQKVISELSATPPHLMLTLDDSGESTPEIVEISTVSPRMNPSKEKGSQCSSPSAQELALKPANDEATGREIVEVFGPAADSEKDKMGFVGVLSFAANSKLERTQDGNHSDDIGSEVDNYMDALTTMDSEMESDNEYKPKNTKAFLNIGKHAADSDANEEQLYDNPNFSDSQSLGNSSISDGGNSSFKKGRCSYSYSDSLSNMAENTQSDGEGTDNRISCTEVYVSGKVNSPLNGPSVSLEASGTEYHQPVAFNGTCTEDTIHDPGEASSVSSLSYSNAMPLPSVPSVNSPVGFTAGPEVDETTSDFNKLGLDLPDTPKNEQNSPDLSIVMCNTSSQSRQGSLSMDSFESHLVDELDKETNEVSDASLHQSNTSDLAPVNKESGGSVCEVLSIECAGNLVEEERVLLNPDVSQTEEQLPCSALPEVEIDSSNGLDVLKPEALISEDADVMAVGGVDPEIFMGNTSETNSIKEQQVPDKITVDASLVELDSTKAGVLEGDMNNEKISELANVQQMDGISSKWDPAVQDAVPDGHLFDSSDKQGLGNYTNLVGVVNKISPADGTICKDASSTVSKGDDIDNVSLHDVANVQRMDSISHKVDSVGGDAVPEAHLSDSSDKEIPGDYTDLDGVVNKISPADGTICKDASSTVSKGDDIDNVSLPDVANVQRMDSISHKVDSVGGDAVPEAHLSDSSDKEIPGDYTDLDGVVTSVSAAEDDTASNTASANIANEDDFDSLPLPSSDAVYSASGSFIDIVGSLSGSEDSCHKQLNLDETISSECRTESVAQMETSQVEIVSTKVDHSTSLPGLADNDMHVTDVTTTSSLELGDEKLESQPHYVEIDGDDSCLLMHNAAEGESSSQSRDFQINPEAMHTDEKDSNFPSSLTSSPCHVAESGIYSELAMELQPGQIDKGGLQADETNSNSLDNQFKDIQILSCRDQEDIPNVLSQQSAVQEHIVGELDMFSYDSVFRSSGEATQMILEDMPPLPPLPPMQWRLGRVQATPLDSQGDWIDHNQDRFTTIEPFPDNVEVQSGHQLSGTEIMQSSNPFLSMPAEDGQKLQYSPVESAENSLQQTPVSLEMPSSNSVTNGQQGLYLNPILSSLELSNERPAHGLPPLEGESTQSSSSNMFPPAALVEHMSSADNLVLPQGSAVQLSDQLAAKSESETTEHRHSSQMPGGEGGHSSEKSAMPIVEEQPGHDLANHQEEITWYPKMLALPPTYEFGKPNGSKLPRPRSPLIDAVAAHDKSKLRKVTDRVLPHTGQKVDERDSFLEQIRTKSFNLKPATVARPSIQGVRGPKTNLKVAAILEKANAIRQALTGSDEDDSDSWSDS